jgi:hypothetical protein
MDHRHRRVKLRRSANGYGPMMTGTGDGVAELGRISRAARTGLLWHFPDVVQRASGAPLIRGRFKLWVRKGPGSAAHHFMLRCEPKPSAPFSRSRNSGKILGDRRAASGSYSPDGCDRRSR